MNASTSNPTSESGIFFDQLAANYDITFTASTIGRAQRNRVWGVLTRTFRTHDNILEINCGTGEDALFMSKLGISVTACDASYQMIEQAELRLFSELPSTPPIFYRLPTEHLNMLTPEKPFDGVFSNFSGLNCIRSLDTVADSLSPLVRSHGQLLLCFSTRFCLLEAAYYLSRGNWRKATRRWSGHTEASVGDLKIPVYYPTVRQLRESFAPHFSLQSVTGVGVIIPPSYFEPWIKRHPRLFRLLCRMEAALSNLPVFRLVGDHILLRFEKVA